MLAEAALNQALSLDPEREEVLAPLAGRRIAVQVEGATFMDMCLSFRSDAVGVDSDLAAADVTVSGTPSALASLLSRSDELPARSGVSVRGDVGLLQQLRRAMVRLRPDWQEPIARVLGDELGHPVARTLVDITALVRRTLRELHADADEYLREESGLVAAAEEVAQFATEVDELRDQRVARLLRASGQPA
jgi:ubiquinone biosynthesis protein UbiJ